jgi:hypothetical protein
MDEERNMNRAEALRIATAILDGEIGLVQGARELLPHLWATLEDGNPDLNFFLGLLSQTDHLPVGPERRHWNREVLQVKDRELDTVELSCHDSVVEALKRIIHGLGNSP